MASETGLFSLGCFLAVLRGNLLRRRHRLALRYLGSLGLVQLAGMLALRTPYRRASPVGVLLPLMFSEWIIAPLVILGRRRYLLLRHIAVNGLHNIVHIIIGITGLAAARQGEFTRTWGRTTGAVLLALFVAGVAQAALAGFPRDQSLLGLVAMNSADHVFHLATGVVALIFGLTGLNPGNRRGGDSCRSLQSFRAPVYCWAESSHAGGF